MIKLWNRKKQCIVVLKCLKVILSYLKMDGLKILEINLANSTDANILLTNYVFKNQIDLFLFQDCNLGATGSLNVAWPTIFSNLKSCGIAVVNSDITFNCILKSNHTVFLNLLSPNGNLGSFYSPPSSNFSEDMDEWTSSLPMDDKNFLLGGDFNAHSVLWGYYRSNQRGEELTEIISSKSLTTHNASQHFNQPLSQVGHI